MDFWRVWLWQLHAFALPSSVGPVGHFLAIPVRLRSLPADTAPLAVLTSHHGFSFQIRTRAGRARAGGRRGNGIESRADNGNDGQTDRQTDRQAREKGREQREEWRREGERERERGTGKEGRRDGRTEKSSV